MKWTNKFRKKKNEEEQAEKLAPLSQYYDRTAIDDTGASYRLIMGQRSNGKTYSILKTILEQYINQGKRSAYLRRYAEEITPKNIQLLFSQESLQNIIIEQSGGKWNDTFYRANCFYLCFKNEAGSIVSKDSTPFCITRAINTWQTTKGQDAGELSLICLDEFATREGYLKDEFICFCNILSSLIRDRKDCTIYMLANTVNKYCPYFTEMGLTDIDKMKQGEIRVYTYGSSDLKVAVEYCAQVESTKKTSSKFFAFNNPQLDMIKNGSWEIKNYDRPPFKIFEEDILKRFWVKFGEQMLCGEIVQRESNLFIFFHRQTKDIEIKPLDIYYSAEFTSSICHVRFINDCPTDVHKLIFGLIKRKAMCFSDNEVGEIVRNWLQEDNGLRIL